MTKAADLNLFINGVPIEQVTHVKLLGVMLDNTLSWSKHIDNIVSVGKGIAVARKCSAFIPSSLLKDVVQSLVLSHLEYCPMVWSSALEKHLKKLQMVQNRAARLVLLYQFRANVSDMHRKLSWLPVKVKLHYDCWYIFTRYSSIILLVFSLKSLFMWDLDMIIKHVK